MSDILKFWLGFISGLGTGFLAALLYLVLTEGPEAVIEFISELWQ